MRKPRLICNIGVLFFLFLGLPLSQALDAEIERARELNQQVVELYHKGKYAEAIPFGKEVLTIREKVLVSRQPSIVG